MRKKAALDPETRKKRLKRRLIVYGCLVVAFVGAYKFQPIEIDFIPRKVPKLPPVDPDSKKLFSKGTRIMVIAAHPDDTEFYISGTLLLLHQAGAELTQLLHTDGDKAYYFWADNSALRETRRREQRTASAAWGATQIKFLGFPDGRLRSNKETIAQTAQTIRDWNPEYIFAFDSDYPPRASHQDHRRSGDIMLPACRAAGFTGWVMRYSTMAPNFVVDVDKVWMKRVELLGIHASQFSGEKLKRIQAFIADGAVNTGASRGYSFAEGFRAERFQQGAVVSQ